MTQSNPAQQAFVRVYFLNSVSTPADYRAMRMGASNKALDWGVEESKEKGKASCLDDVDWEMHKLFPQPDVPTHGSAVLGLPDAAAFLKTCDMTTQERWLRLVNSSVGAPAWALVAQAAWMSAADQGVLDWMDDVGWFDHDVRKSIDAGKDRLVAVRRALTLSGHMEVGVDQVLMLRKMANIADRNKEEADWDAERKRRTTDTAIHWFPCKNGDMSRARWLRECRSYLESFTLRVARKMSSTLRLVELDEWWASRYNWVSTGSSSETAAARKVLEESDMVPDKASRPNKKAVAVTLPEEYIYVQMLRKPYKRPRKSTKHEPGRKNRALYAQDDASFFVSAFGSVAMERSINEDGILARQTPEDVVNWMGKHKQLSAAKMFFMSLDYSDYNTEHEPTMLAMLDAAWARAWFMVAEGRKVFHQKAWAALWSAEAHLNSWVDFGHGDERVMNGLFSGDRNTSRDNCILHAVYSHCMQKASRDMMPNFRMEGLCMTGDDEDAAFGSSVQAACYMCNHAMAGFVLKVEKQLAGTWSLPTHEYLQRALTSDGRPSRPLAAALGQVCSGNWYKTQYIWFDSIINSVNDNAWELHTRGLPLHVCQLMAAKTLSRSLTVPDDNGKRRDLEWWDYRTNGAYHPLWGTVTGRAPQLPDSKDAVKADPNQHGILAWSKLMKKRFGAMYAEKRARRYEVSCAQQALSSVFMRDRYKLLADAAALVWPTRTNKKVNVLSRGVVATPRLAESRLTYLVTHLAGSKQPESLREVLSRLGVDEELVETLGGLKEFIRSLRPSDMQYWSSVGPATTVPRWAWHEDPAVRSQLGVCLSTAVKQYERWDKDDSRDEFHVIVAGNASGKSTAMQSTMAGTLIDMDNVIRQAGINKVLKQDRTLHKTKLPSGLVAQAARVIAQTPGKVILSQYPLLWMQQILGYNKQKIKQVVVVLSTALTIWERTACERAWDYAKAERRADRANRNAKNYAEVMEVRSAANVMSALVLCQ